MNQSKTFVKKINSAVTVFVAAGAVTLGLIFLQGAGSSNKNVSYIHQQIVVPEVPVEVDFCGEKVPLEDFEVYERLEREVIVNTFWHSSTILTLKRMNRWFPLIEQILEKNNIPDDFKYLAAIESGLTNAVSPKDAVGYWQFLDYVAESYGLEVNKEVDERYNVEKSTEAACLYLNEAYQKFGTWTLAAASYNFGIAGIDRQLKRQKSNNYYDMTLGDETSRYVLRIVAMKLLHQDPKKYGYYIEEKDLYTEMNTRTVTVTGKIDNLADFALKNNVNYKILKYYNPWLRDSVLTNPLTKTYSITLPEED